MHTITVNGREYNFHGTTHFIQFCGEHWDVGWDIPTIWAISADRKCWINDGHGGDLVETTPTNLLGMLKEDPKIDEIRGSFGLKPKKPAWIEQARKAGWTPPSDWDESVWCID